MEHDGTLIERSTRGRPDAFVEVVQRHEVAVHAYLARRAGVAAAADLLGEVWVRAFACRAGFDLTRTDARPWLYGIARNVLRAYWRAALAETARQETEPAEDPWDEVVERLDDRARLRSVACALRALPPAEREALVLIAWEQLTPAQAAEVLGVPPGTVRSRLHRARARLAALCPALTGRQM